MRQAFDGHFIEVDGKKVGIFTGADFCTEHEWGIKDLRKYLSMDSEALGVENRRVREWVTAVGLKVSKPKNGAEWRGILCYGKEVYFGYFQGKDLSERYKDVRKFCKEHLPKYGDVQDLYCEWCENGCLVAVSGKENVALLERLYAGVQKGDGFLGLMGGGGPFNNGGLTLVNIADIPAENKQSMLEADNDRIALKKAAADTGIEAKLRATQTSAHSWPESGCKWYALSPKWNTFKGESAKPSKYPVVFWLSPSSQDKVNYGWFTVEELELWIQGQGPIPKVKGKTP
jgi:hypothetical protein